MRSVILKHKKAFTIISYIMLIFFGCFTFPAINISRSNMISWYNTLISFFAYYEIGLIIREIYEEKYIRKVALASVCFTIIGYMCRYYLEFGEVSNTYNFTFLNIVIHTLVAGGIPTLTALFKK